MGFIKAHKNSDILKCNSVNILSLQENQWACFL